MPTLKLPAYPFRVIQKQQKRLIFDEIRRKYLQLTPEEWVRQHFVQLLVSRGYPKGCISIERKISDARQLIRRTDILVYNRQMQPFLLVECKAPEVPITQQVFEQASHYNLHIKATTIVCTNGMDHFIFSVDHKGESFSFLNDLPEYPSN